MQTDDLLLATEIKTIQVREYTFVNAWETRKASELAFQISFYSELGIDEPVSAALTWQQRMWLLESDRRVQAR